MTITSFPFFLVMSPRLVPKSPLSTQNSMPKDFAISSQTFLHLALKTPCPPSVQPPIKELLFFLFIHLDWHVTFTYCTSPTLTNNHKWFFISYYVCNCFHCCNILLMHIYFLDWKLCQMKYVCRSTLTWEQKGTWQYRANCVFWEVLQSFIQYTPRCTKKKDFQVNILRDENFLFYLNAEKFVNINFFQVAFWRLDRSFRM